jgi:hypothetical protein
MSSRVGHKLGWCTRRYLTPVKCPRCQMGCLELHQVERDFEYSVCGDCFSLASLARQGMKLGPQEQDSVVAHGAAKFCRERIVESS